MLKFFPLIGALLLSTAPVQSQPNSLYSDICDKSEENLKGCKVVFIQGGITALCEGVNNGFVEKGDYSDFVQNMLRRAEGDGGEDLLIIKEAIQLVDCVI